ncbi:MAG TPA: ATP synthase F1 subunit epsilon [Acidimicrobiales bacterium]|nr:ATP synthase F1 subunit epsilon [Acidimicrobiales bacterium]
MTAFALQVVTPERILWSGDAEAVSMRTEVGEITFLAHHTAFIAALDVTVLRISGAGESDGEGAAAAAEIRAAVHGGFVHVDDNKVVILASVAELAAEIDVERARRALAAAEERVGTETEDEPEAPHGPVSVADLDPSSAKATMARARVRLEAAGAA